MRLFTCFTLCWFCFQTNAQKIYKWTDKQGNVHYGEKKPNNNISQELKITQAKPQTKTSTTIVSRQDGDKKNAVQKKFDEYRKKDKQDKDRKKIRLKKCKQAKESLNNYQKLMSFKIKDNRTGGFFYLTDAQKSEKVRRYQKHVDKYQKQKQKYCGR